MSLLWLIFIFPLFFLCFLSSFFIVKLRSFSGSFHNCKYGIWMHTSYDDDDEFIKWCRPPFFSILYIGTRSFHLVFSLQLIRFSVNFVRVCFAILSTFLLLYDMSLHSVWPIRISCFSLEKQKLIDDIIQWNKQLIHYVRSFIFFWNFFFFCFFTRNTNTLYHNCFLKTSPYTFNVVYWSN